MDSVSYDEGRLSIHDGDIVFIRDAKGWIIPHIIRFFTRSAYTHAGIAFWIETGSEARLMIVEAQGGTSRRVLNLSYYEEDCIDVIKAPGKWDDVSDKALARLNQVPYGWLEAMYVGLRESLLKYFDVKWLPMKNLPGEICSEFVGNVFDLPERHISPQRLSELLQELGHNFRIRIRKQG